MDTVHLAPDGTLRTPAGSGGSAGSGSQGGTVHADPLPCLRLAAVLDPGCTLRSFFALLTRYAELQRLGPFLPAAVADAARCPAEGCRAEGVTGLALRKTVDLIGYPGGPRAEIYLSLRALAPGASSPCGRDGETEHEIRFIPLDALLDLPLSLGGLRHVVFGDRTRVLDCETTFSLFEVIEGLAWELGFQGGARHCSLRR